MKTEEQQERVRAFSNRLMKRIEEHSSVLPIKEEAQRYIDDVMKFLFPQLSDKVYYTPEEVEAKLTLLNRSVKKLLKSIRPEPAIDIDSAGDKFIERIPEIYDMLWEDADAIFTGDPAAESVEEVILAYPGFFAICIYRFAHELYLLGVPILPRLLTEYAHQITGVDIHPGAQIGRSFFIDHGTGVVVGETTVIGNNVKMYQGVTLGALSVAKKLSHQKRHPTIEDNVILYSQAVILGGETVIGHHSVIGGNAWLTSSVPPYSLVTNTSKVSIMQKDGKSRKTVRNSDNLPEPISFII